MIHLTPSNTKLNILFNNTNKALVQVLLDASKTELKEILKNGADLRSIIERILKQTSGDNSSNKALLALVKKNPTLNNLGDTSTTIKQLLKLLQSEKTSLPIERVLKNILVDIKDIKSVDIKSKLENSGVFLESKIKNIQNPIVELKNILKTLKDLLSHSKVADSKVIIKELEALLENKVVKKVSNNELAKGIKQKPTVLEALSKQVKSLVINLQKNIKKADPIYAPKTKELLAKLEFSTTSTKTKNISITKQVEEFKQPSSKISNQILSKKLEIQIKQNITIPSKPINTPFSSLKTEDTTQKHKEPTKSYKINEVVQKIKPDRTEEKVQVNPSTTLKKVEIDHKTIVDTEASSQRKKLPQSNKVKQKTQVSLPAQNVLEVKSMKQAPIKLQTQTQIKTQTQKQVDLKTVLLDDKILKLPMLKESLQTLRSILNKSLILESKPLLNRVEIIIQNLTTTKEPSTVLKQDIAKFVLDTKQLVQKSDIIYSKDVITLFSKLKELALSPNLNYEHKMKEMLSNDLKATLLHTTEDLQNSSSPNKHDLIKHLDKLVLQIDNLQLISYLGSSSNIYLPITWEQLEGGNIDVKRDKDKFYCDIELQLKNYGEIGLKLMLFEKNQINIHLYSKSQELKDLFQEHLGLLRAGLISTQIIPREIRFHDTLQKQKDVPYQEDDDFAMGFEVKG